LSALELLQSGDPIAALEQLKQEVRKAPRDARLRTFLFQLFCIVGEWDRALTQLAAAAELDPTALPMAQAYRAAIRCELLRERVFAGTRTPTLFGNPESWVSLLIEANRRLAAGAPEDAATLRDKAFEEAAAVSGSYNGQAFEWVADADPRLGPILEAIVEGKYYWVPFYNLKSLDIEEPQDLRDQVWMPAHFVWSNGGEAYGFVPTRYPGSAAAGDPTLALSRSTEWRQQGDWYLGLGQRMLTTDTGDVALMDLRRLEIAAPADAA
jgi:type VI secretion system protein ImpE